MLRQRNFAHHCGSLHGNRVHPFGRPGKGLRLKRVPVTAASNARGRWESQDGSISLSEPQVCLKLAVGWHQVRVRARRCRVAPPVAALSSSGLSADTPLTSKLRSAGHRVKAGGPTAVQLDVPESWAAKPSLFPASKQAAGLRAPAAMPARFSSSPAPSVAAAATATAGAQLVTSDGASTSGRGLEALAGRSRRSPAAGSSAEEPTAWLRRLVPAAGTSAPSPPSSRSSSSSSQQQQHEQQQDRGRDGVQRLNPYGRLRSQVSGRLGTQQHQQQREGTVRVRTEGDRQASAGATATTRGAGAELRTGLALTWLGTNSGTPTLERNVSCTLLRLPGVVQMVDCGEGTHRQIQAMRGLEAAEVDGIFITHLHGDHCFGLGATLALLDEAKARHQTDPARRRNHVYGPPGLAELVRASLVITGLARRLQLPLTITEFVCSPAAAHPPRPMEEPQPLQQQQQQRDRDGGGAPTITVERLAARRVDEAKELQAAVSAVTPRLAELTEIWRPPQGHHAAFGRGRGAGGLASFDGEGSDAFSSGDEDPVPRGETSPRYRPFFATEGLFWEVRGAAGVKVRAAQLQHRVACWGYVFQEAEPYQEGCRKRKVVVLGDTVSSRPIAPLAAGCDVIAHEATFSSGMEAKARLSQHSTGWMAGAFAAAVGARSLVLTHFSARYREGPRDWDNRPRTLDTSKEEADQQTRAVAGLLHEAAETFGKRDAIFAASDFFTYHVPLRPSAAAAADESDAVSGAARRASEADSDGGEGAGLGVARAAAVAGNGRGGVGAAAAAGASRGSLRLAGGRSR